MNGKIKLVLILIFICSVSFYSQGEIIRIVPKQSNEDISHSYFVNLLKLALKNTESEYGKAEIETIDNSLSQGRALFELQHKRTIDVYWAGTDEKREEDLQPVRVPLIGGLLGYRVPVIRKESLADFQKINDFSDLKKFIAIQGTHWPDSDILESAGLKVNRVPEFKLMYNMLKGKRVDYFPRGLNEVYSEVEGQNELIAYDSLLIVYKFPMYFFTSKNNQNLAERLEKGLRIAIENGSFLENMKTHPVTASMFPLSKYKNSKLIYINNPSLPKATPINDSKLWIELK